MLCDSGRWQEACARFLTKSTTYPAKKNGLTLYFVLSDNTLITQRGFMRALIILLILAGCNSKGGGTETVSIAPAPSIVPDTYEHINPVHFQGSPSIRYSISCDGQTCDVEGYAWVRSSAQTPTKPDHYTNFTATLTLDTNTNKYTGQINDGCNLDSYLEVDANNLSRSWLYHNGQALIGYYFASTLTSSPLNANIPQSYVSDCWEYGNY